MQRRQEVVDGRSKHRLSMCIVRMDTWPWVIRWFSERVRECCSQLMSCPPCRTSHALLSHMENYYKFSHHRFRNKIIMPGCRCTNKESCSIKHSLTSKWKCLTCTPIKQRIELSNPNSWKCSRALLYKCEQWFYLTITWKYGSQFSPVQYCCWPITNYSFIIQ